MTDPAVNSTKNYSTLTINIISIVVPLIVAILLAYPYKIDLGDWSKNLPHVIGSINSLTAIVLLFGLFFIKRGDVAYHRIAMVSAFFLGIVFLICYVTYHISNPSNRFGGEGAARYFYLFILLTHVLLSLVVLPLVLRAMFYAVTGSFEKHKKIVKYAYPIWLYVSISGVAVYTMLYHLFPTR